MLSSLFLHIGLSAAIYLQDIEDPRVEQVLSVPYPCNGVATTPAGRLWLNYGHVDQSTGPDVVEYDNVTKIGTPYPSAAWNNFTADVDDPAEHFIGTNAMRIGPDGNLYVVDTGSQNQGTGVYLEGGMKLVQINTTTDTVQRVYDLSSVAYSSALLNDVRFNTNTGHAYLSESGSAPGLIVLDLDTGAAKHVLTNSTYVKAYMPLSSYGVILWGKWPYEDEPVYINVDHLEVSPDGAWLYFESPSGGMHRIATAYLDAALDSGNATLADTTYLEQFVEPYAATPSVGGTAMDAEGNIYFSDQNRQAIGIIYANGTMDSFFVQDPRLEWIDAMWVSADGRLWMPDFNLENAAEFHNGTSMFTYPVNVYTIPTYKGLGPSAYDHA